MLESFLTLLFQGGWVLYVIVGTAFLIFSLALERIFYYVMGHGKITKSLKSEWDARSDRESWNAHAIRDEMVSRVKASTHTNVEFIKVLVAIAPLLGLLGTVWGMINVFDDLAFSAGATSARSMSGGIFKAIIPTMAGLLVSLLGLLLSNFIERKGRRETAHFAEKLAYE